FVAQSATVLYWFHPLVWVMARAMRAERERACDDQVLAAGTKASDYAHELLDIVSSLRRPELAAALAMARRSQLEGRVLAVLNPSLRRGPVSRRTTLVVAALVLCAVLPVAALRPVQENEARPALAATVPGTASAAELENLRAQVAAIESELAPFPAQAKAIAPEVAAIRAQIDALESGQQQISIADNRALLAELDALQQIKDSPV